MAASSVLQYTTSLSNAVVRMRLSNGCKDNTFDFYSGFYALNSGAYLNTANANAPSDKRCKLFDPAGGDISARIPVTDALDWNHVDQTNPAKAKVGHATFRVIQVDKVGTTDVSGVESANDLLFIINYINRQTCMALNNLLDVQNLANDAPAENVIGTSGQYVDGSFAGAAVLDLPAYAGKHAFCRYLPSSGYYQFVHVLMER